jgi:hypothetical protein
MSLDAGRLHWRVDFITLHILTVLLKSGGCRCVEEVLRRLRCLLLQPFCCGAGVWLGWHELARFATRRRTCAADHLADPAGVDVDRHKVQ